MILTAPNIPYDTLAPDMFRELPAQRVVPFLGAGVSTSARSAPREEGKASQQDPRIQEALERLVQPGERYPDADGAPRVTLDESTRLYAEIALEMAFLLQQMRTKPQGTSAGELMERLRDDPYPPSGGDLVDWLARSAPFGAFEDVLQRVTTRLRVKPLDDSFKRSLLLLLQSMAGLAGVSAAPLSVVSAFFEVVSNRTTMLNNLSQILSNKAQPTPTHQLVARAAKWHLQGERQRRGRSIAPGAGHYLIMTTNYDTLMESALQVPYVVLTLGLKDSMIRARFGNMSDARIEAFSAANPPRAPRLFSLDQPVIESEPDFKGQRLAIVYKAHGCIIDWTTYTDAPRDSIVISDNDYVTNISRFSDNDGVIPACVSDILSSRERPYFLFMGYSLRDWNIRGMLRVVRTKRAGAGREDDDYGDYSVVRNFGPLEQGFFLQHKIRIIHEDLGAFSQGLGDAANDR